MAEPTPTYHIDIWTIPEPTYVCAICIPTARYTLEEVTTHLREVHNVEAIPTPNMDQLLLLRAASDQRMAEAAGAAPTPGAPQPSATPSPESPGVRQGETAPADTPPLDRGPGQAPDDAGTPEAPDAPAAAPGETPAAAPAQTVSEKEPAHG